jgi:predicted dehydrogenase
MSSVVRVGMIGTGGMGTAGHLHVLSQSTVAQVVALCDVNPRNLAAAAERFGVSATYADYRELLEREELDVVDIVTPNNVHAEISIAAIRRGVHVLCEKPLALDRHEAREMMMSARTSDVKTAVNFSYRNVPAARFIREIITSGEIGDVYHMIATYNQGWLVDPNSPHVWRLVKSLSGTGVLGDLGSHLIDLARFWIGDFTAVAGHLKTFINERPRADGSGHGTVDVDDAASFLAEFANGATGSFFCTRFAFARANSQRSELYGTKGGIVYDNERPNEIQFSAGSLMASQRQYATMPVPGNHREPRSTMQLFAEDIRRGTTSTPTFEDGLAAQEVLDAVEASAQAKGWATVPLD